MAFWKSCTEAKSNGKFVANEQTRCTHLRPFVVFVVRSCAAAVGSTDHALVDPLRGAVGLLDEGRSVGDSVCGSLDSAIGRALHIDHLERLPRR